jgi:signal transduction histidine kinase
MVVTVEADAINTAPALPAAVEVAALRIASEAVTNAARHAAAAHCRVAVCRSRDTLYLDVTDDGRGIDAAARPGVGVLAMHERTAELGGTCSITPGPERGTRVHAAIPIPSERPAR